MLNKNSKIRVLEFYNTIDKIFFGKNITKVKSCCPLIKEDYLNLKGALLSIAIEMMKLVDYNPKIKKIPVTESDIEKSSMELAKITRKNTLKIMREGIPYLKERAKKLIYENKKIGLNDAVKRVTETSMYQIALDNLIIENIIKDGKKYRKINTVDGKIIEGAYKIVRNEIVERIKDIMDSIE